MATDREKQLLLDAVNSGITSSKELANFMGQVTQESGGLKNLDESFRYTRGLHQIPVASARKDPVAGEIARVEAVNGHPEKLAELMYGNGKMGNDVVGDGYKYRGRGYIQLTGKDNYEAVGKAVGLDLVKNPELAADPEHASKIAVNFWNQNVHKVAPEDVAKATHIINKAGLGLENRKNYASQWEAVLTPQAMAGLARGEVLLPDGPVLASPIPDGDLSRKSGHTLKQGAHGDAVGVLQADLRALGYSDAKGDALLVDKDFGAGTDAAVRAFQHDHHLLVDGAVGTNTVNAIHDLRHQKERDFPAAQLPTLAAAFDNKFVDGIAAAAKTGMDGKHRQGEVPAVSARIPSSRVVLDLPCQEPGPDDPRHSLNPNNALYNKLQERIPDASESRLLQFTTACHSNKITADNLSLIHLDEANMTLGFHGTSFLSTPALVDLSMPPPLGATATHQIGQQAVAIGQNQSANVAVSQQNPAQAAPQPPTL